jgi:hypothetical protein
MSLLLISWGNQEKIGPGSESLANGEVKLDAEKNPEEVAAEQGRVLEVKTETRTEVRTSSWRLQNRTVLFPKPDHPVYMGSRQKKASKTTAPETAPRPHWCPPELMPN